MDQLSVADVPARLITVRRRDIVRRLIQVLNDRLGRPWDQRDDTTDLVFGWRSSDGAFIPVGPDGEDLFDRAVAVMPQTGDPPRFEIRPAGY